MRASVLIALLLTGTAAQAQIVAGPLPANRAVDPPPGDSRGPRPETWREVRDISRQVDRARETGALSRKQARALKRKAGGIGAMASRYARDGLSLSEERELEVRAYVLRDQLNLEKLRTPERSGKR